MLQHCVQLLPGHWPDAGRHRPSEQPPRAAAHEDPPSAVDYAD